MQRENNGMRKSPLYRNHSNNHFMQEISILKVMGEMGKRNKLYIVSP